ncbi:predicted protein [Histoplasma capsulatum G186AR]|uniref:Uncharacterized protein n=1 Tax=Ajellomyces capsulatus (strain G186AR / H82 / ATCC MYA-2454 / RMSCC 2432) TaxID=447093 RepID=C0NVB4_AJECG|nr:uncharacterized protein HCBG_07094 [Histoplasma capsulatum G186AR]EEH04453.1 predicted protein [Histoplasma capsulatum G186AR]
MADTAVIQSAPNGTATAPTTPNNVTGPDNAANVALPEDTPADATLISRTERANVKNSHGTYWRFCKKCRNVRPTRWRYWEDRRNPATSRYFWYFVTFAWRYLSASRCPECKCSVDEPLASPRQGEEPNRTTGSEQERTIQATEDVETPE